MSEAETCSACDAPLGPLERRTVPYACGLPGVYLEDIRVRPCTVCANYELTIPHVLPLQHAIARAVAQRPGHLSGEKIRFLRKHLNYTHAELGKILGVAPNIVSRWEEGQTSPHWRLRVLVCPELLQQESLVFRFTDAGWELQPAETGALHAD